MRLGVAGALIGGEYRKGDVEVDRETGRVSAIGIAAAGTGLAVPGLIDMQVNGFAGVDFLTADVDAYRHAGAALARTGVVAYQPTLITSEPDQTIAAITTADLARSCPGGARILGVHLEAPFLSPERAGTQSVELLRKPDIELSTRLLASGPVTQVTLAPELPGSLELVVFLVRSGVRVSCGHSDATAAEANAAFDRGARLVTHLFDAMRPFTHRDPGIVGAALTRDDVAVGVIADSSHLSPEAIRLAFRAARGRIVAGRPRRPPRGRIPRPLTRHRDAHSPTTTGREKRCRQAGIGNTRGVPVPHGPAEHSSRSRSSTPSSGCPSNRAWPTCCTRDSRSAATGAPRSPEPWSSPNARSSSATGCAAP